MNYDLHERVVLRDLPKPFTDIYKSASVYYNPYSGRRTVALYPKSDKLKTKYMFYARYLMCCKYERILSRYEEVDHIDSNKLNDDIDNLQVVSRSKHLKKTMQQRKPAEKVKIICPECGKEFERIKSDIMCKAKIQAYLDNKVCCSRSCSASVRNRTRVLYK